VLKNAFRRDTFLRAKALVRQEAQEMLRSVREVSVQSA
jgi:hypothetical protein